MREKGEGVQKWRLMGFQERFPLPYISFVGNVESTFGIGTCREKISPRFGEQQLAVLNLN
jgi:hypothetical protein